MIFNANEGTHKLELVGNNVGDTKILNNCTISMRYAVKFPAYFELLTKLDPAEAPGQSVHPHKLE